MRGRKESKRGELFSELFLERIEKPMANQPVSVLDLANQVGKRKQCASVSGSGLFNVWESDSLFSFWPLHF